MNLIQIVLFLFSVSFAASRPDVAVVEKVRGTITQLSPGQYIARKVSEGDKLKEDTSIVTGRGSFVRIRFIDNSVMSLGPESKAVIVQIDKKDPSIVSLLKGKMRNAVQPNAEGKEKFYVKTRTAAMGVRGTDFQTLYNPENKVTNLLTYNGEVAMVKTDDTQLMDFEKEVHRTDAGDLEINTVSKSNNPEEIELKKLLQTKETVVVKAGQFSGSMEGLTKVTEPVIVNPVQVNALYKNSDFLQKKESSIVKANIDSLEANDLVIKAAPQETPPEGFYDEANRIYALKSGGLIDLETGIYVFLGSEANFDPKNKVFIDNKIGQVDVHTGQYQAPKGLALDPVRGFMVKKAAAKTREEAQVLLAQARSMNKNSATDIILTSKSLDRLEEFERYSQYELVSKDSLEFLMMGYSNDLKVTSDTRLGTDQSLKTKSASLYQVNLGVSGYRNMRPVFEFTAKREEYDLSSAGSIVQNSHDLLGMAVRLDYASGKRVRHSLRMALMQEYFLDHTGSTTVVDELRRASVPRVGYSLFWNMIQFNSFAVNTLFGVSSNLPRETGSFQVKSGLGLHFGLDLGWWVNRDWKASAGFKMFNETQSVSNTLYSSKNTRTSNGLFISISRIF